MEHPHPLLEPLNAAQQRLVDVVADAFLFEEYQWPFFDYVQGVLDDAGLDAVDVLTSFPMIGRWGYGAVAWNRNDSAESEVALTVVGMSHTAALRDYVPVFFTLVDYLAQCRRHAQPSPREVRSLTVSSDQFDEHWREGRRLPLPPRLTAQLKEREPLGWGSRSLNPDGNWTTDVRRDILRFEGMKTLDEYVQRLEEIIGEPVSALPPILPSPLSLAAALDYLNAVWRLTHDRERLFDFTSAERTTRLAYDVQTAEEFAAHLSAFTDLLRQANRRVSAQPERKERGRALARIEADVVSLVGPDATARVIQAIRMLEFVVALRDADQHGGASDRAVAAYRELRIPYPTTDWRSAWSVISTHAIGALNVIREELETVSR
jgi:hypothetical protein